MSLYIIWASFLGLLALQAFWSRFAAYPIAFEKNLKKGKSWVYIPLQWKGFPRLQIVFLSKLIIVCVAVAGGVLLARLTGRHAPPWLLAYAVIAGLGAFKLNDLWLAPHYRLQEDCYFLLFDELRIKLELEGRDLTDAAFKSLADYQYQNHLRKADESGRLLEELRNQSRRARERRKERNKPEPPET